MEIKELEALARLMKENDLCKLEISEEGSTVRLEREPRIPEAFSLGLIGDPSPKQAGPFAPAAVDGSEVSPASQKEGTLVLSPTVGVFYSAPSPESDAFVSVGDRVKKGDTLCIIEAMKLMNEIPAELDGTVAEILASNGQVVEYNQPLFRIVNN